MEPDLWQEYLNYRVTVVDKESDGIDVEIMVETITFCRKATCVNIGKFGSRVGHKTVLFQWKARLS